MLVPRRPAPSTPGALAAASTHSDGCVYNICTLNEDEASSQQLRILSLIGNAATGDAL